jgi:hypothetical protein
MGGADPNFPRFSPFSPQQPNVGLAPDEGVHVHASQGAPTHKSLSTLLSPAPASATLPGEGKEDAVEELVDRFQQIGVSPPGRGAEDSTGARREGGQ